MNQNVSCYSKKAMLLKIFSFLILRFCTFGTNHWALASSFLTQAILFFGFYLSSAAHNCMELQCMCASFRHGSIDWRSLFSLQESIHFMLPLSAQISPMAPLCFPNLIRTRLISERLSFPFVICFENSITVEIFSVTFEKNRLNFKQFLQTV